MEPSALFALLPSLGMSFLIGLVVAPFIYRDAKKLPALFLGIPAWVWAVSAPFFDPLWVTLVYWLIHHSTISNRINSGSSL
jgi:hypothetical protein